MHAALLYDVQQWTQLQLEKTMPPKQKKKTAAAAKKKKGKQQPPSQTSAEPSPFDSLSLEELRAKVSELEAKHSSLLDAANHAQVEHDAVLSYYEVTRDNLHKLQLEIEQAERNIEEAREHHSLELSVYDDRSKRIQYDHANHIKTVDEERLRAIQTSKAQHANRLQDLNSSKREVLLETQEMQVLQTEEIREAKKRHARRFQDERMRLEGELVEFERKCQNHHVEMIEDVEAQRKADVRRAEERGKSRQEQLEAQHQDRLEETRVYFEGIVEQNEAVVRSLRDEIDRLEDCADRSDRKMAELTEENERLAGPLAQTLEQMRVLTAQSKDYEKDGEVLMNTKGRIALTRRRIKDVQRDYEDLQKQYEASFIATTE